MRRWFTTIAVLGSVLALTGALFAQAAKTTPADKTVSAQATTAEKKAETEPTYTGIIEKFDATAKVLTIKHKNGELAFTLVPDCIITEGATKLASGDLSGLAGRPAKIYYTAAPGEKMAAHKIVIEKAKTQPQEVKKDATQPVKK